MSEVVVSKVTNVAGDYFIDAAQPGSIIQVQAYDYSLSLIHISEPTRPY